MDLSNHGPNTARPTGWSTRWRIWRNRLMASAAFRRWASRTPLIRGVARRRATELFDLVAGFVYAQTLFAAVETGLLDVLGEEPVATDSVTVRIGLGDEAAIRLLRACAALGLIEEIAPGYWMLGAQGAILRSDTGIQAMIRHHKLLYADLADPVALLKDDRQTPTRLSDFWSYAGTDQPVLGRRDDTDPYSRLMAATQGMVTQQILASYDFDRHRAVLDVGGGHGVFAGALRQNYPGLRIGVFDLPAVVEGLADADVTGHPGDFFADQIPQGYDCITLVRILHDHDDDAAAKLLRSIFSSLAPGSRLLIAEPMAGTRGAEAMGDAYFGLYLWAMRSGRPRRAAEIGALLDAAGFRSWKRIGTDQPLVASLIVAAA